MTMGEEADLLITIARDRRLENDRPFPPGWMDLVVAVAQQIQLRAPGSWILTIREIDGVLDISIDNDIVPPAATQLFAIYRDRSERTCVVCGEFGHARIGALVPWAICDRHYYGERI